MNDCGRARPGSGVRLLHEEMPRHRPKDSGGGQKGIVHWQGLLPDRTAHERVRTISGSRSKGKTKDLEPGELGGMDSLGLEIKAMEVDHSIYGATAYAVETEAGWIVYSGDIRLHGAYGDKTRRFMSAAKALSPAALIIEGTRASRDDAHFQLSEADVASKCRMAASEDVDGLDHRRLLGAQLREAGCLHRHRPGEPVGRSW